MQSIVTYSGHSKRRSTIAVGAKEPVATMSVSIVEKTDHKLLSEHEFDTLKIVHQLRKFTICSDDFYTVHRRIVRHLLPRSDTDVALVAMAAVEKELTQPSSASTGRRCRDNKLSLSIGTSGELVSVPAPTSGRLG